MSAAERLQGVASCSSRCAGLARPLLPQRPAAWAWRGVRRRRQQPQAALALPPLQQQQGALGLQPLYLWRRRRRSYLAHAGNSMRDIGDDLREIGEDIIERVSASLGGRGQPGGGGGGDGNGPGGQEPGGRRRRQQQQQQGGDGSSSSQGGQPPGRNPWTDWSGAGIDEDWDAWSGSVAPDLDDEEDIAELREQIIERRRRRQGKRSRVRDEYLRPIVDAQGIYNRLTYDEREAEERVFVEAITNQYESKEGLIYLGWLVVVPLAVGFVLSRAVAEPLWGFAETVNPLVFDLSDEQKIEGAHELRLEELRIRMEASIGRTPPLTDEAVVEHLAHEAHHIADEFREGNKRALLNVVSDSTSASVFFLMLLRNNVKRQILFRTIGRVFSGLSDTAKAFLIILVTDILLGYHSEEGWTAFLKIASRHYGAEPEIEGIYIFVSTVPVLLDTCFKYWIFVGLNKEDPAAAVTLKQMDRH